MEVEVNQQVVKLDVLSIERYSKGEHKGEPENVKEEPVIVQIAPFSLCREVLKEIRKDLQIS